MHDYVEGFSNLGDTMDFLQFTHIVSLVQSDLVQGAIDNELNVRNWFAVKEVANKLYRELKDDTRGANAQYIPALREIDASKWAVSLCSVDGQRHDVGDYREMFSMQSLAKPIIYGAVLDAWDEERVHYHMGQESWGSCFQDCLLMETEDQRKIPPNPLLNAGAIMCASILLEHSTYDVKKSVALLLDISRCMTRGSLSSPNPTLAQDMEVCQ